MILPVTEFTALIVESGYTDLSRFRYEATSSLVASYTFSRNTHSIAAVRSSILITILKP